jgi:hypothetical protein
MFHLLTSSGEKYKSTHWVLPSKMCISAFAVARRAEVIPTGISSNNCLTLTGCALRMYAD